MEFTDTTTPNFEDYKSQNRQYWRAWHDSDKDAFASWAQMYYPNAFQAALLNYQNEYEKPINQMLRYQQAGISPYSDFSSQSSSSGSQGSAPTPSFGFQEIRNKKMQNFLKGVQDIVQIVGAAKEVYDYMSYGRSKSFSDSIISSYNADAAQAAALSRQSQAAWDIYWNTGQDTENVPGFKVSESPRAVYMENSTQRIANQVEQIAYMVDYLYPSQVDANEARAALVDYQKEIEQGRYDAVLSINTGNKNVDAFLRALCMFFIGSTSMGVGISHKF